MKILMVLTSHNQLGDTGKGTGFWLEEFAAPYYVFRDAGAGVTLASPAGGQPPMDPNSDAEDAQTQDTLRFKQDTEARRVLAETVRLADVKPGDYDAVFYPGGHGPLWDLVEDGKSVELIESLYAAGKPVAAVCHAPAVLRDCKTGKGDPLVKDRQVTGFSNAEEEAVGLTDTVPFLVEDMLRKRGAYYAKGADWSEYVVADGNLITGQNPASSKKAAEKVLEQLQAASDNPQAGAA